MGRKEMVPLTPKTQLISVARMLSPVLWAYEPIAACWEVLYLFFFFLLSFFFFFKRVFLVIWYLFVFFPSVRPCWGHSPCHEDVVKECDQHCPFPRQHCVCCSTQAPCLLIFTSNWFSLEALSCLKHLGKRQRHFTAWALPSGDI